MGDQAIAGNGRILLKHGAGGRAMRDLIRQIFLSDADAPLSDMIGPGAMDDGAALRLGDQWLVITTDSYVIQPPFFPGGDIGRLAIAGTVNDLAMMGATEPLALTCAVVIEEGFARRDLERIQESMRAACRQAGVAVVTGDTKVMGRGELDGIIINTAGVAFTREVITDRGLKPGDRIVVTGTIGDHGLAVMACRHDLGLDTPLCSDVAPLNSMVRVVLEGADGAVSAMKDPTRGGLASALHEMAEKSGVGIELDQAAIPLRQETLAVSELLGIDPLLAANEGKAVLGVRAEAAAEVVAALRGHPLGMQAAVIGTCVAERPGVIVLDTGFGRRILNEPEGEPLPRIC
jgi:hydrogenase expression/formation protein HypE